MSERSWRDAKIPKWVSDDVERELRATKLTLALSWPTEARPSPAPFQWGDYDNLHGDPVDGTYWVNGYRGSAVKVDIRYNDKSSHWKKWEFREEGFGWSKRIIRGHLYYSERDARLAALWRKCEECAESLMVLRSKIYD